MKPEKLDKIKKMREYLKSLSKEDRQQIADKYGYHSIDGHTYSRTNQCFLAFQTSFNDNIQGTFAGFKQWKNAGRTVKKGEHGYMIWFPAGFKNQDNDIVEVTHYYTTTVFDISQTEELKVVASVSA